MTHRQFEGWDEYSRRLAAATEAGSPDCARLPQTEAVMRAEGGNLFFTGRPCKRGHVSPRGANRECTQCNLYNQRAFWARKKNAI